MSEKLIPKCRTDLNCAVCGCKEDDENYLTVPAHEYANYWICRKCCDKFEEDLKKYCEDYFTRGI